MGAEICEPNIDVQEEEEEEGGGEEEEEEEMMMMMMIIIIVIIISYRTLSSNLSRELAHDCEDEKNEVVLTVIQNNL